MTLFWLLLLILSGNAGRALGFLRKTTFRPVQQLQTQRLLPKPHWALQPGNQNSRPMLQSIDENKFNGGNLLQRVVMWPQRKSQEVSDFFSSNLPMLRFLWPEDSPRLKFYLVVSMVFMFFGKWFNLRVPFLLQKAVDSISSTSVPYSSLAFAFAIYGMSRTMSTVCAEIKTCLFVHVSQNVLRKFANQIFAHLHSLDAAFHLSTPSGVISVAYVRAVRGFQTMLFQLVFSVAPTLLELAMVLRVMQKKFDSVFALVTFCTFSLYLFFTVYVTQWRVHLRQELVDVDNARNGFFIDSVMNHEVVKLFDNAQKEQNRFDSFLQRLQKLSIDSTVAIAWLNLGQTLLFTAGLTTNLLLALNRVRAGKMSIGDLIAVNGLLLQLSLPFNFVGYTYQELRQAFVDMSTIRDILRNSNTEDNRSRAPSDNRSVRGVDRTDAVIFDKVSPRNGPSSVRFHNVSFSYSPSSSSASSPSTSTSSSSSSLLTEHQLKQVSFSVPKGANVAIVGPSGAGKSTILKLLTRMLEPTSGSVIVDDVDISAVTLSSLRQRLAVVPQDCSLFDETIRYNILYGKENATDEEVERAVSLANLDETIAKLPMGLETPVGERGAKLSGGERQRVSIARAIIRDPSLILCDEVTASVDAFAERDIVHTLRSACHSRTTITVAHRLSSIAHCDHILVMQRGRLVQQGNHHELLQQSQGLYAQMWSAQNPGYQPAPDSSTYTAHHLRSPHPQTQHYTPSTSPSASP